MAEVVAFRVDVRRPPRRSRTLDEHLFVRLPALYRALSALVMRLSPGSRLRRALLRSRIRASFAAFNRRDFEPVLVQFAHDIEYEPPADVHLLGFSGTVRGRDALGDAYAETFEDWERWKMTPVWIVDRGDVFVVLSASHTRGRESRLELESQWASVYRVRDGLVARQQDFLSWEEALRAVPFDPGAIPVPLGRTVRLAPTGAAEATSD